jgi:hypothetical protein
LLSQIDLSVKLQKPKLQICKPNKIIIGNLTEEYGCILNQRIIGSDELSFKIPYIIDKNHQLINNSHIPLIKNKYLIKLTLGEFVEWFVVENPSNTGEDDSDYLLIQTFSLEYELSYRFVRDYHPISILLSDVVNNALLDTAWTLGSVPTGFNSVYREFDVSSQSILSFILDIADKFNLIAIFDTNARQVNFYNKTDIGQNKGLVISETKYLKTISDNIDNTKFCTRLKMFGKDDITFAKYNPTGQNFVEDYTYFLLPFTRDIDKNVLTHSDYWSDELCQAQLDYQVLIASKVSDFNTLRDQIIAYNLTLATQQSDLNNLNADLEVINNSLQTALANTQSLTTLFSQQTSKRSAITAKQNDLNVTQGNINSVQSQIDSLQSLLSLSANFSSPLLLERNQFIIQQDLTDNAYTKENDLYLTALSKLEELKIPPVLLKISIVNFLESITEQKNWNKLVLGDTTTVKHNILNVNVNAQIIETSFDFEQGSVDLIISNIAKIENADQKIAKLLNKSNSVGNIVDINKPSWTNSQTNSQAYTNTQVQSLNQSLIGLATTTNIITSDGYITIAESQTLNTALNQLNSESTDIINKAVLLGNTNEKTNYQTALTNLQAELNDWIGQSDYPIYIASAQRSNINTLFQNVQNTKSLLLNAQSEMRNTNVAGWGIESGGAINYTNLRITIPAKTLFVSYTGTTVTVSSTSGFPASGDIYYEWNSVFLATQKSSYTSIDATHFYGVSNISQFANIVAGTSVYIYPNINTGVLIDVTIDAMTVVNKINKRFNISATTFANQPVNVAWNDDDGWEFRYIYLDSNGVVQLKSGGTWGGITQFPPLVNVNNPSPYIWIGNYASYSALIASVPSPGDKWAALCLDTMTRYVYLTANSTWNDYGIYDANAILLGYFVVGHGIQTPDGQFSLSNLNKSYLSDGTPNYQIIKKQDFRYRNDKLIQYNITNVGVNITTYDSQIITATVSAGSYYTTYIPLGVGKRQCDVSITSSTSITAADTLVQGAKFTVGRKPGGGSSAGIKLVSGVYVNSSGSTVHVDQKRNSTTPAYGDYIIPPTSLNVTYTTIYDMDLMPYPSDPTQICLKVMFYNYFSSSETVNLRFTWQAT